MQRIIINADDFGASEAVNKGIVKGLVEGFVDRTTLMVNMPYADQAVEFAKKNGVDNKVGLHLNLTSGQPLTKEMVNSPFCKNGEFTQYIRQGRKRFILTHSEKILVKSELEAQMEKYYDYGLRLRHLDSHQHIHNNISVTFIVLKLAKKYDFSSMRICRNIPKNNISIGKLLYKSVVNHFINVFNNNANSIFGSYKDYCNCRENSYINDSYLEIMTHPVEREDGKVMDVIDEYEIRLIKSQIGDR